MWVRAFMESLLPVTGPAPSTPDSTDRNNALPPVVLPRLVADCWGTTARNSGSGGGTAHAFAVAVAADCQGECPCRTGTRTERQAAWWESWPTPRRRPSLRTDWLGPLRIGWRTARLSSHPRPSMW